MGEHIFSKYIEAKVKEWDAYRIAVTDWEKDNYLSIY
ncbi:MAG: glutamine synthetase [Desulfobulbaceae bacterium]|nr:glutamine synthetase [Desulfobulbaceae bacterium]